MTIDLKTVKHISKLSRISIDDQKAKKLEKDLNSIFKWIEKLNELNTDNVEPLTSIAETALRLRKDQILIPRSNTKFEKGDTVVFLCNSDQISFVENMFRISSI